MIRVNFGEVLEIVETNMSKCSIYKDYVIKSFISKYPYESNNFIKEVTFLSLLKNANGFPRIVELKYDNHIIDNEMKLISSIVMTNVGKPLTKVETMEKRLDILHKILVLLRVLHKNDIVHCDIKPDNVVIDNTGNVSIIDFSHSQILHPMSHDLRQDELLFQTCCYMAPESYLKLPKNELVDIWSLGCLYYELIVGDYLFPGQTFQDIKYNHQNINYSNLIMDLPIDDFEKNLLYSMVQPEASSRPTAKELLQFMGHGASPSRLNKSTTGYRRFHIDHHNPYRPIWFNLDEYLSNLGYHILDYITKLQPKLIARQYELSQVIFAIIHLLYYPTMDENTDVFSGGFLSCMKKDTIRNKSSEKMLIDAMDFIANYVFTYPQICHCLSSFLSRGIKK